MQLIFCSENWNETLLVFTISYFSPSTISFENMNTTVLYLEKNGNNYCSNSTKTFHYAYAQPLKCKRSPPTDQSAWLWWYEEWQREGLFWSSLKKITPIETNLFEQLAGSVFCSEPGCDQHDSLAIICHPLGDKPDNSPKSTLQMQLQPAPVKLILCRYTISK